MPFSEIFVDHRQPHDIAFPEPELSLRWSTYEPDHVKRVVDSLPGPYRCLIEWQFYERAPVAEVARRLGVQWKSVKRLTTEAGKDFIDRYHHPVHCDQLLARKLCRYGAFTVAQRRPCVYWQGNRVRGPRAVLRLLDETQKLMRCPGQRAKAQLLREYSEIRLLRRRFETVKELGIIAALQD